MPVQFPDKSPGNALFSLLLLLLLRRINQRVVLGSDPICSFMVEEGERVGC